MTSASRVALVTGASQGIGRVVASELAASGFRVAAAARSVDQLKELEAQTRAVAVPLDVTDPRAVTDAVARVESELGPIDLLVNNAGISGPSGASWELGHEEWWNVFEVNVLGTFLCSRAVMPAMVARGAGRIVNVSSNAAFFRIDDDLAGVINSAYMASKAAVIRFTEALAAEARPAGVSVFAISPGTVKTDMTAATFADKWDDSDFWSPPKLAAELIAFISSGALDALSGRYIHAAADDWRALGDRGTKIVELDLHTMRLRSAQESGEPT
jgi:NAD(P)-dependent dehydrogenase (short-subunit alcohol dehydrogenase family)